MVSRYKIGKYAEQMLVKLLNKYGYATIRAPASGARARKIFYPDVVAIKNNRVLVFEVKRVSSATAIYIPKEKISKLVEWARKAGGEAYIAVKQPNMPWIAYAPDCGKEIGDNLKYDSTICKQLDLIKDVIQKQ